MAFMVHYTNPIHLPNAILSTVHTLSEKYSRKGLARAGNTKKRLKLIAFPKPFYQSFYRPRLVAGGLVFGM